MKKYFILLLNLISLLPLSAEDVIQIIPLNAQKGTTKAAAKGLEINLVNSTFDVANLQFDILLPEGITLTGKSSFQKARVPYTNEEVEDDEGETTLVPKYDFSFQSAVQSSGYTRFMFIPGGELRPIPQGEGVFLKLGYTTSPDMPAGVYPILMTNIKLVKTVTESISIPAAASYVVVSEDGTTSPLPTATNVDISGMKGYIPSFVVESLNTAFSGNTSLRMLNMSGATELGTALNLPSNEDLLWYTASKASLNRTFTADKWSTVCLPFGMNSEQVAALKSNGCVIEKLTNYNDTDGYVDFTSVDATEAHTPYLVKSSTTAAPFTDVNVATVDDGSSPVSVTVGNMSMIGSYAATTVSSSASVQCFGFSASDGSFKAIATGANIPLKPFRAYLALSGVSSAPAILGVAHDGFTTGIALPSQRIDEVKDAEIYNLQGQKVNHGMTGKGIYIRQGKKILMK